MSKGQTLPSPQHEGAPDPDLDPARRQDEHPELVPDLTLVPVPAPAQAQAQDRVEVILDCFARGVIIILIANLVLRTQTKYESGAPTPRLEVEPPFVVILLFYWLAFRFIVQIVSNLKELTFDPLQERA